MSISSISQASFYVGTWDGQNLKGNSGDENFQFALDELVPEETGTSGPLPFWIFPPQSGTPTTSVSVTSETSEFDPALQPKTFEDLQKELDAASDQLAEEFLEFSEMSPAEKIRARALGEKDMTEEDLAKLAPEERAAIEEEIKQAILHALGVEEVQNGETETSAVSAT